MKRLLNIVQEITGEVQIPSKNITDDINYAYYVSKATNDYDVGTLLRDNKNKLYIVVDNSDVNNLYLASYSDDYGTLKFYQNEYNRLESKTKNLQTVDIESISFRDVEE